MNVFWEGEYCCDNEDLLIIRTSTERVEELKEEVLRIHFYDLHEVIVIPVTGGTGAYPELVKKELKFISLSDLPSRSFRELSRS